VGRDAMAAAEPAGSGQQAPQGQAQGQRPQPQPAQAQASQPPPQLGGVGGGSSRHEKSLGLLTTKFVSLLQEAKDGVLDLKAVSSRGGDGANFGAPTRGLGGRGWTLPVGTRERESRGHVAGSTPALGAGMGEGGRGTWMAPAGAAPRSRQRARD
jgi:hypothetical protein